MTDITKLAQREKFEAWWEREYKHLESSKYTDAVPHIKYGFWMAYQAGGAELVEALEKSEKTSEARREAIDITHKRAARERDRANAAEEALEKAQAKNALVAGGIEAATKLHERIAYLEKRLRGTEESLIASADMVTELESRTVKLPEPVGVVGNDHWIGEMNMRSAVIQALKSAGIKREDE